MKLVMTDGSYFEGTVEEMIAVMKTFKDTTEGTEEDKPLDIGDIGEIVVITGNNTGSVNVVGDIGRIVDARYNDRGSVAVQVPGRPSNSNYTGFFDMRRATASERELYARMEDY